MAPARSLKKIAVAGGQLVGAAFAFIGEMLSEKNESDEVAQLAGAFKTKLSDCLEKEEDGSLKMTISIPDEIDMTGEEPRIGVFVCDCGINIAGVVDVPAVVEYAKSLPNVAHAQENLFSCSQDNQDKMKEIIKERQRKKPKGCASKRNLIRSATNGNQNTN